MYIKMNQSAGGGLKSTTRLLALKKIWVAFFLTFRFSCLFVCLDLLCLCFLFCLLFLCFCVFFSLFFWTITMTPSKTISKKLSGDFYRAHAGHAAGLVQAQRGAVLQHLLCHPVDLFFDFRHEVVGQAAVRFQLPQGQDYSEARNCTKNICDTFFFFNHEKSICFWLLFLLVVAVRCCCCFLLVVAVVGCCCLCCRLLLVVVGCCMLVVAVGCSC